MDAATRDFVRRRAGNRCEYCLLDQRHSELAHHVEHIVARQHGGDDHTDNLALAWHRCNLCKGPNLTGLDPVSGQIVHLFHPRRDRWPDHFTIVGPRVEGQTAIGRATVQVLGMKDLRRQELRRQIVRGSKL